jgi:hypothetical protein
LPNVWVITPNVVLYDLDLETRCIIPNPHTTPINNIDMDAPMSITLLTNCCLFELEDEESSYDDFCGC